MIGICNLAGSSIYEGKNSNSDEIIAVVNLLKSQGLDCRILQNEKEPPKEEGLFKGRHKQIESFYYSDPNKFDQIIIMNGSINCFGGIVPEDTVYLFKFLKASKAKLYYFFNDSLLKFSQLSKTLKSKTFEDVKPEDVHIDRPITVISSFKDLAFAKQENSKEGIVDKVVYFDSGKMILNGDYKAKMVPNKGLYDIIYGGSARRDVRLKSFNEFFCTNLKTALYGNLKIEKLNNYKGEKFTKVKCTEVIAKNSEGKATCIMQEKHYNNGFITRRVYESMMADCIVFFEDAFDSKHLISPFPEVYIRNKTDLETKFAKIFGDEELKNKILNWQHEYLDKCAAEEQGKLLAECLI
ncbi:MAG: hypothetical protein HUJ68_11870 [Clostridia bacterium]|mgnify:CR=1 FL=1|nr:hypothetical protein [Clostridia bacterium]